MTVPTIAAPGSTFSGTDVTVTGTVNPGGASTQVTVEWSLTPAGPYTIVADDGPALTGSTDQAVSITFDTGDPDATVYWRLRARNADGARVGVEQITDRGAGFEFPDQVAGFCGWEFDDSACTGIDLSGSDDTITETKIALAGAFAGYVLWVLSGRTYGTCTRTIRPCTRACEPGTVDWWDRGLPMHSVDLTGGLPWPMCGCQQDHCGCTNVETLNLPRDTIGVREIVIDGVVLPASAWRLARGGKLYRTDGGKWPTCQDFAAAPGEVGTWTITFKRGVAIDAAGRLAGGQLRCEILKSFLGKPCGLPERVKTVTRNQTTMTFIDPMDFLADGKRTGLYLVDLWLGAVNPGGSRRPPRIIRADDPNRHGHRRV